MRRANNGRQVALRETNGKETVSGNETLLDAVSFEDKVAAHYTTDQLDNINAIFGKMREGRIDGRVVITF
jgi:propanol-preferring alcohol dehydrogenase